MPDPNVTSTQAATVIATPISGDYRIDVLLDGAESRWNAAQPLGSPVEVTYSFMAAAPSYASDMDRAGFSAFTDAQTTATQQILAQIAQQFNISFRLVQDTATSYGQIRLGDNAQGANSAGYAYVPDANLGPTAGDVYINNEDPANLSGVTPGTNAYATLVHEIGHALGLKHPGNYNGGEPVSTVPGNFLAASEDSEANSVMSYVKTPQMLERDFYGKYDMLALAYLYGSRAYNASGTTYALGDNAAQRLQLINDGGGVDTIDASQATVAASIDLRDGASSSIGRLVDGTAAIDDLTIAYGSIIENAVGTSLVDTITGNGAANTFTGGGGNDVLDGGAGVDIAAYLSSRASYSITANASSRTVSDTAANRDGTDTLLNVERLRFSDESLAFDVSGNAGTVVKILGAVFGAGAAANKQYVGIGLGYADGGMSYQDLMLLALNARLGAGFSNDALVTLLYQNLVGSAPGQGDLAYWSGTISSHQYTQASLAVMAADTSINAGNVQLAGLAATGVEYLPLA